MKIGMIFFWIAACVLLNLSIATANEESCNELIAEAEELWADQKFDESDKKLDRVMKVCPKLSEPCWRKGRNIFDRLESIPRDRKPEKKELVSQYREVEALADRCIEIDERDGHCWLWKVAGMGRRGTTQGVLKSLFMVSDIEKALLKAESLGLTYRSKDGLYDLRCGNYYALGIFYRSVPEWLCHFPLKQMVGTCGDKAKSITYQRKAHECQPKNIAINKELATSLLCHGQEYDDPGEIEEAKNLLKALQSLPDVRPFDKIDKLHARMLLADPSLACGYQRDKQQEVSEEAYARVKSK
jgi:hypothetical protein